LCLVPGEEDELRFLPLILLFLTKQYQCFIYMGYSYSPETGFRELTKRTRISQPLIALARTRRSGVMATQNGPNLDYAGNCTRKAPSFAVALNCGTGSSFLNALVNAFDRLHIVRAANSGYCGSK
jgi:hypothetical protein